jgi:hypothetical protein
MELPVSERMEPWSWLPPGLDLDAAHAELIEHRGEGILVDTDLANLILGGYLAAGEAVDVELRRVAGVGAADGAELLLHRGGIVGKDIELLALEDEGTLVCLGCGADTGLGVDLDLLV